MFLLFASFWASMLTSLPHVPQNKDKDKVGSLFDRARAAGAESGTAEDLQGPGGNFRGAGRTLAGGARQVGRVPAHLPDILVLAAVFMNSAPMQQPAAPSAGCRGASHARDHVLQQ